MNGRVRSRWGVREGQRHPLEGVEGVHRLPDVLLRDREARPVLTEELRCLLHLVRWSNDGRAEEA